MLPPEGSATLGESKSPNQLAASDIPQQQSALVLGSISVLEEGVATPSCDQLPRGRKGGAAHFTPLGRESAYHLEGRHFPHLELLPLVRREHELAVGRESK